MTMPNGYSAQQDNVFLCFERQAEANATAVAVIDEQGAMTYGELAVRADAIARHLIAQGLQPEQPVGVLMARRADLLAVLLGIWKAGGAYVPFDPQDPVDRIRRMAMSSDVTLFVGDPALLAALRAEYATAGTTPPRAIDPASVAPTAGGLPPLPCAEGGPRLAYLLFTSGSTGDPKAVAVEHRQVLTLLRSACELLRFEPNDRYLAASTIAFDASITELYLPLITGASLVLRDRAILIDPHRFAREIREYRISVVQTGPSVWRVALDAVRDFPRLRVAITHGEAVSPDLARRIAEVGEAVWNLYGPTETTVWATGQRLRRTDPDGLSGSSAPIGRPLAHVRAIVIDEQGQEVADGTPGELCLGGPSVARGYRDNEALTAERFTSIGGQRVYRSGDVVVRDAHGVLHYFGRNDDQIKVRGIRVEPGEIETAILRDPRVAQAAATWYDTASGTRAIVAAVVLRSGADCTARDLHGQLVDRLPSAMIPARFLFVPWLPMTTSGKVDRKAIRAVAQTEAPVPADPSGDDATQAAASRGAAASVGTRPGSGASRRRPLTYTEEAISRVWQRMLKVTAPAHDDHFFSIGGDSLSAVQMMVAIEARFGLVLPVHLAFEAPTLEALAARIDRIRERRDDEIGNGFVYPLVERGSGAPLFFSGVELSLARRGVWTAPSPLYAIANWAKGSGIVHADSLEALASQHLAAIRRIQPEGPYRLAGFSLGGLIAFEMAQQLRASGQAVEFLFLLDPMAPNAVHLPGASASASAAGKALGTTDPLRRRITRHLRQLAEGPGDRKPGKWAAQMMLLDRLPPVIEWLYYVAVNQYLRHPNAASRLLFPRDRWRAFWFAAQRMVRHYSARPYDGAVLAVFSGQGARADEWNALLPPDAFRLSLDAPHLALFEEPALGRWMTWLADYISGSLPPGEG